MHTQNSPQGEKGRQVKYTVTMVLTADRIDAFSTLTLGKKLEGGAEIRSFGIGDYIDSVERIREPFDCDNWDNDAIAVRVREVICEHDHNVSEQLSRKAGK